MEVIAFYFFGALSIALFLIVVSTDNLLYALAALAGGMILLSPFFFLLGAEFIGVAQIIVYTGAVIVVYAFALMFFDSNKVIVEKVNCRFTLYGLGTVLAILLLGAIILTPIIVLNVNDSNISSATVLIPAQNLQGGESPMIEGVSDTHMIGYRLFTQYLIPFEIAAIMLLVAMIAGIILAGKRMDNSITLMNDEDITEGYTKRNLQ